MNIENVNVQAKVIWQAINSEDEPIAEPAVLVEVFSDTLALTQDGSQIILNRNKTNLRAIRKVLDQMIKEEDCPEGVK